MIVSILITIYILGLISITIFLIFLIFDMPKKIENSKQKIKKWLSKGPEIDVNELKIDKKESNFKKKVKKIKNTQKKVKYEKEECCVCLESTKYLVKFYPCKHKCVCIKCITNIEYSRVVTLTQKIHNCPICRANIKTISLDKDIKYHDLFCNLKGRSDFFKFVKGYTTILTNTTDIESFILNIIEAYEVFVEKYKEPCLISSEQSEILLGEIHKKGVYDYRFLNLFVCMCANGWNVDVNLGGHGVCYFGNLGDPMVDYNKLLSTLQRNHKAMILHNENNFF